MAVGHFKLEDVSLQVLNGTEWRSLQLRVEVGFYSDTYLICFFSFFLYCWLPWISAVGYHGFQLLVTMVL